MHTPPLTLEIVWKVTDAWILVNPPEMTLIHEYENTDSFIHETVQESTRQQESFAGRIDRDSFFLDSQTY